MKTLPIKTKQKSIYPEAELTASTGSDENNQKDQNLTQNVKTDDVPPPPFFFIRPAGMAIIIAGNLAGGVVSAQMNDYHHGPTQTYRKAIIVCRSMTVAVADILCMCSPALPSYAPAAATALLKTNNKWPTVTTDTDKNQTHPKYFVRRRGWFSLRECHHHLMQCSTERPLHYWLVGLVGPCHRCVLVRQSTV